MDWERGSVLRVSAKYHKAAAAPGFRGAPLTSPPLCTAVAPCRGVRTSQMLGNQRCKAEAHSRPAAPSMRMRGGLWRPPTMSCCSCGRFECWVRLNSSQE